jgi:hypothetical protein
LKLPCTFAAPTRRRAEAGRRKPEWDRTGAADFALSFRCDIRIWSQPKVLALLCETISFLSDDDYEFEFQEATNPTELANYLELSEDSGTFKADEVVLFSGGLDSLSGAVEEGSGSYSVSYWFSSF